MKSILFSGLLALSLLVGCQKEKTKSYLEAKVLEEMGSINQMIIDPSIMPPIKDYALGIKTTQGEAIIQVLGEYSDLANLARKIQPGQSIQIGYYSGESILFGKNPALGIVLASSIRTD